MDILKIFRIIGTEFRDVPDEDILDEEGNVVTYGLITYINLYKDEISRKRFGKFYNKALAYLIAHNLKMLGYGDAGLAGSGAALGDSLRVSSYSEGETSISFSNSGNVSSNPDEEYGLTVYGVEFLKLRKYAIIPIISAGEGPPHE